MNDKKWIVAGLALFLAAVTFPFWYQMGKASLAPEPKLTGKAAQAGTCVEPKAFMKTRHRQLLGDWRRSVVRDGNRVYLSSTGKSFNLSLTQTCLDCHGGKNQFCDHCHTYLAVQPDCWDCHIDREEIPR